MLLLKKVSKRTSKTKFGKKKSFYYEKPPLNRGLNDKWRL